jgi:DNA-binding response OmpR family regulator
MEGGCAVSVAQSVTEALHQLRSFDGHNGDATPIVILVASVRAGAIPFLTLLREKAMPMPMTLVYDEDGNDMHTTIRALQLGVREYILASAPEKQRRLEARLLAERAGAMPQPAREKVIHPAITPRSQHNPNVHTGPSNVRWDAIGRVIRCDEQYVRLSSVEGRIFDVLLNNRSRMVAVAELVSNVLMLTGIDLTVGARRLRPHVMRLRRKLDQYPGFGMRIINMRGAGYMLV